MSADSASEDPGVLTKAYRTVTPGYRSRENAEMHTIGLTYLAILAIVLIPLLPFVAIVWAVSKLAGYLASLPGESEEPR
jgi:hypothetical protein